MFGVSSALGASLAERLAAADEPAAEPSAAEASAGAVSSLTASLVDQRRRLQVACTQLAEFAAAKEQEADLLKTQVLLLAPAVSGRAEYESVLAALHSQLLGAAAEAGALAKTHRAEAEKARGVENASLGVVHAPPPLADPSGADGDPMEEAPPEEGLASEPTAETDFRERSRYIPLRLTLKERQRLRLLEAALSVSEYTDKVDVISYHKSKSARINAQLRELCGILCGLVLACDYKTGQELVVDHEFKQNADFFQTVFELGRRHKVMNPEKMRSEYGKLIYLLQDSQLDDVQVLLDFALVCPLKTVHTTLQHYGALEMLDDPLMSLATGEILSEGKIRGMVSKEIRAKERAREHLAKKYASAQCSEDTLLACLYSIGDNNTYLRFNRDPVDRMICYLKGWFDAKVPGERSQSLAISLGCDGARLSHNHERQYTYVLQSLTLWREIAHDMFKLWYLAEQDLLRSGSHYRLTDTGQGLNRVQQAPAVGRAVHAVLARCQASLGSWVGSSVVHLGDHNVPNALMFIDKYTQVPRILGPIVLCIEQIDALMEDTGLASYIEGSFGGAEKLKRTILGDFFRHAFDGSGADNFFDAGSCIDGRLTSAWNWCSKIEKKAYFPIFKLTGFQGFDGDWQK